MDLDPIDPTKDDMGAAGGARGGGDENPEDYKFPDPPTDTSDEQRRRWPGGARPKDPYRYEKLPQHDKDNIPMSTFPPEKKGLPSTSKDTEETSFIEGNPSGRVRTADSMKMELAHQMIADKYPEHGKDGKLLTLEVQDGKVFFFWSKGRSDTSLPS